MTTETFLSPNAIEITVLLRGDMGVIDATWVSTILVDRPELIPTRKRANAIIRRLREFGLIIPNRSSDDPKRDEVKSGPDGSQWMTSGDGLRTLRAAGVETIRDPKNYDR